MKLMKDGVQIIVRLLQHYKWAFVDNDCM